MLKARHERKSYPVIIYGCIDLAYLAEPKVQLAIHTKVCRFNIKLLSWSWKGFQCSPVWKCTAEIRNGKAPKNLKPTIIR